MIKQASQLNSGGTDSNPIAIDSCSFLLTTQRLIQCLCPIVELQNKLPWLKELLQNAVPELLSWKQGREADFVDEDIAAEGSQLEGDMDIINE